MRPVWRAPGLFWFLLLSLLLHLAVVFLWPEMREEVPSSAPALSLELEGGGERASLPAPEVPEIPQVDSPETVAVKTRSLSLPAGAVDSLPMRRDLRVSEVGLPESGALSAEDLAAPSVPGIPRSRAGQRAGAGEALADYFSRLLRLIEAQKTYPLRARLAGYEGEVTVSFVVEADGRVRGIKVVKPSPFAVLNQAARRTIERAAPFPPPPRTLHPPLELSVKLTYRLDG